MEHTDLTEFQQEVLSLLLDEKIPVTAKEVVRRHYGGDNTQVPVALNKLSRMKLVDKIETAAGNLYEINVSGRVHLGAAAPVDPGPTLSDCGHYEVSVADSYGEEGRVDLEKPAPSLTPSETTPSPGVVRVPVIGECSGGPINIAERGSVEHLLAAIDHEPLQRPDDLDDLLADLKKLTEGLADKYPSVADGLRRVRMYLHRAYPKSESTERVPA